MPTGFHIGPVPVYYYGIILMLGALAGAFLASSEARRRGQDTELVWDGLIWVLIGGILGARIWHILTPPPSMVAIGITTGWYLTHPLDMISTWNGGLGIPGAIIGGGIALYLFCRRRKVSFPVWLDIAAPGVALGQAIGRWGNYVNQELYGAPSNLPWAIHIDANHRLPAYQNVETYHPIFLYESLWSLMNMAVLLWLARRHSDRLKSGDIFLIYLIIYPLGRFLLEFLRLDASRVAGLNANQTIMAIVFVAATLTLIWRHRQPASEPKTATIQAPAEVTSVAETPVKATNVEAKNAEAKNAEAGNAGATNDGRLPDPASTEEKEP
jgi:phosphatidylglycerol:prolipoprotein diacylglycerol transferase